MENQRVTKIINYFLRLIGGNEQPAVVLATVIIA
jgi:hypothetical protein